MQKLRRSILTVTALRGCLSVLDESIARAAMSPVHQRWALPWLGAKPSDQKILMSAQNPFQTLRSSTESPTKGANRTFTLDLRDTEEKRMGVVTPNVIYTNLSTTLFPLWGIAAVLFVLLPASAFAGYIMGKHYYIARGYDVSSPKSLPGDTTLGATLAMLGLLIAFVFGFAINWGDKRTDGVTEEAAALGTAFLRAHYVAEPGRSELRGTILDYARTLVPGIVSPKRPDEIAETVRKTMAAQAKLWPATIKATGGDTSDPVKIFVAGGVTDVLDSHTRRIAALSEPIPIVIKLMMAGAAMGALFLVGNNSALRGRTLTWRTFMFAALLAVVMLVILDIEQPQEGWIRLNEDALMVAIAEMESAIAAEAADR
jgi:hypothetical protein